MTVRAEKPSVNLREKLAELDKPTGIAGEAMLRAETPQEQFNLIGAGRRNLIINGAMKFAQRGASFTVTDAYTLDRYKFKENTGGAAVVSQSTEAPDGFTNSLKISPSTADTSLGSTEHTVLWHFVEGNDFAPAGFGSSGAKPVTLSFWVRSNKLGTYSIALGNSANNKMIVMEYTIDASNVWEHKVIVIPPATDGSWVTDTGIGAKITFGLASGTTYTTSTIGSYITSNDFVSSNCVNFMDSTSNEIYITGVQLELGKVATPFEHRSYGEELALCQRYFYRIDAGQVGDRFSLAECSSTTQADGILSFPVTMRSLTGPTGLEQSGTASDYAVYTAGGSNTCTAVPTFIRASNNTALFKFTVSSGLTAGNAAQLLANTTDAYLAWSDEL